MTMAASNKAEPVETLRAVIATLLDEMAVAAGDSRFRAAAAIVRGKRAGRRRKDDSAALDYAAGLLDMRIATSAHRACEMAAVLFAPSHQVEAMRDRLRKKLRTKLNNSEDATQ